MVAYIQVAKYAWHLPLYRQAQMLLAQGLDIKRAILAFWMGYAAAELKPLYLRLRELILSSARDHPWTRPSACCSNGKSLGFDIAHLLAQNPLPARCHTPETALCGLLRILVIAEEHANRLLVNNGSADLAEECCGLHADPINGIQVRTLSPWSTRRR